MKDAFINAFFEVGIRPGDTILLHSDASLLSQLTRSGWKTSLSFLHSCLEAALGPEGTLVVPTFNYDFCRGKPYDHAKTPSQVGLFTNYILRNPKAIRSLHPIFSFAAIGPKAKELCEKVSHSAFGEASVFDRLFCSNAKLVFFNTSFETCTFIHYVEQKYQVDYRYLKTFTGQVSLGERLFTDSFDFYVRDLERNVKTSLEPLKNRLQALGFLQQASLEQGQILQVSCEDLYRETFTALKNNPYFLLAHPAAKKLGL